SFQVEGMPFLRMVKEPEYWTTPHVKNSKLKQDGKKITIPIQWYLNPNYQDKATKEQKEKKFKQLESQYDQIKNKAVADWDHDEPAPVPSTGDPDKDKWFQAMEKVLERMAPQEYKLVSYPVFDGTQDPYEWLIKYENSCTINRVRNGRKLELLDGCLEGSAQTWWRNIKHLCKRFGGLYDQSKDKKESFKFWFLEQYCGPDKQYEWNRQLRKLSQQLGETVSSYATKLTDL